MSLITFESREMQGGWTLSMKSFWNVEFGRSELQSCCQKQTAETLDYIIVEEPLEYPKSENFKL